MEKYSEMQVTGGETASLWTEEKHVHFLNAMEASFVSDMFNNNCLRLDRHLPDTAESTLDSFSSTKNHTPSGKRSRMEGRKLRRRTSQPSIYSSQDQVVPQVQLENVREGEGGADTGYDDKEQQRK